MVAALDLLQWGVELEPAATLGDFGRKTPRGCRLPFLLRGQIRREMDDEAITTMTCLQVGN